MSIQKLRKKYPSSDGGGRMSPANWEVNDYKIIQVWESKNGEKYF